MTKKVGSSGRFGSRYGARSKKVVAAIEAVQRARHECPSCQRMALRRFAAGIWECRKCEKRFVGGAYKPQTGAVQMIKQALQRQIAARKAAGLGPKVETKEEKE